MRPYGTACLPCMPWVYELNGFEEPGVFFMLSDQLAFVA